MALNSSDQVHKESRENGLTEQIDENICMDRVQFHVDINLKLDIYEIWIQSYIWFMGI